MPILFALVALVAAVCAGYPVARRVLPDGSRGEKAALGAGLALAAAAYLIFFCGLAGALRAGLVAAAALLLLYGASGARQAWRELAACPPSVLWSLVYVLLGATAVTAALAPPLALDWDTLAYHLALPKIWLHTGRIQSLPYDHHSYFPQLMETLYAGGLAAGGYGAAKLLHTLMAGLAVLAAGGFAARQAGRTAALATALAVAVCPLALWEAGTGYIDMATALYTALALSLLFEAGTTGRTEPLLGAAICAGLTAATKYTGLLTIFLLALVALVAVRRCRWATWKAALTVLIFGLAVASPWYVRTLALTGNPVYPFAYGVFGGKFWSERNAEVYRGEQVSFGVGREPYRLPLAPWDLTTQPDRYLNQGGLIGAIGLPLALAPFLLAGYRDRPRVYWWVVGFALLNVVAWFWLSQQSRYILALAPALGVLVGCAAVSRRKAVRYCIAGALAAQAAYGILAIGAWITLPALPVAFAPPGSDAVEDYLRDRLPQFRAAAAINQLPANAKVALYDEVLGFYFDREYSWSNPGHHTLIPYADLHTGAGLVQVLRIQGFTHVLLNVAWLPSDLREPWLRMLDAGARTDGPLPKGTEEWRRLIASAVQSGLLAPERADPGPGYRLYRIAPGGD